jgi:hypothetical protein
MIDIVKVRRHGRLVTKNPRITLLGHLPTNKLSEGGYRLAVRGTLACHFGLPRLDGEIPRPLLGVDIMEPKPLFGHPQNLLVNRQCGKRYATVS